MSSRTSPDIAHLSELCLAYLAEHPEELLNFMQQAGFDPNSLRQSLGTERLQRGLIDHFAANEGILLALCANNSFAPETFMRAWHKLNPAG